MSRSTEVTIQRRPRAGVVRRKRRDRRHRTWVRVHTDSDTYVGCVLAPCGRGGLDELLNDGRAYLALRDATLSGSTMTEEFVALHKGVIRSIVVLGPSRPAAPSSAGR